MFTKPVEPKEIRATVRSFRLSLGCTQQQFAFLTGLAIRTVCRYELSRAPTGAALVDLARLAKQRNLPQYTESFLAALADELGVTHIADIKP